MKMMTKNAWLVAGFSLLASCGAKLANIEQTQGQSKTDSGRNPADLIAVPVGMQEEASFGLTQSASTAHFELVGCASGYTKDTGDITLSGAHIDMYKFDQGCKVELKSYMDQASTVWVPESIVGQAAAGVPALYAAIDWSQGQVITYQAATWNSGTSVWDANSPEAKSWVTVATQVDPAGADNNTTLSFQFQELKIGNNTNLVNMSSAINMQVDGQAAADVSIQSANFVGIAKGSAACTNPSSPAPTDVCLGEQGGVTDQRAAPGGAGKFSFDLVCNTAMTEVTPGVSYTCGEQNVDWFKYTLVQDPNGTAMTTADTFTFSQLAAHFATLAFSPSANRPNYVGTVSGSQVVNTGNGYFPTDAMYGYGQLHTSPNMLLVVQAQDPSSGSNPKAYTVFDVDFCPIDATCP